MQTIKAKRTIVADILDLVRQDLADRVPHEEIERKLAGPGGPMSGAYNRYGYPKLAPLQKCHHASEIYMDNCSACAPRWGHVGPKVVCT